MIIVVMNGWPATADRVFRSFLMCSTCFKRMTVGPTIKCHEKLGSDLGVSPSTLRSIFRAKTFWPSFGEPAKHESHTRANVPGSVEVSHVQLSYQIAPAPTAGLPVPMVLSKSKSATLNCLDAQPTSLLRGASAIWSGERDGPLHS